MKALVPAPCVERRPGGNGDDSLPVYVRVGPSGAAPRSLAEAQRAHIEGVLNECEWNIAQSARILDVDRSTLYGKIKKYGLERSARSR